MPATAPIEAIIFDRDGVLTYFDVGAGIAFFEPLLPVSIDELNVYWREWGGEVGFPSNLAEEARFWHGLWERVSDALAVTADVRARLHSFDYLSLIRPFPDARPALEAARQRGLATAVLSNFSLASIDASLQAADLDDLVDVAHAATVIGAAKPAPAAYLSVTERLGVEPARCLFFDDEAPCVAGAQSVGMHAYLVDRQGKPAVGRVSSLEAITSLLAPAAKRR